MATYTQVLYHVVFSTHERRSSINDEIRDELHAYLGGTLNNYGCPVYAIGGTEDHVHVLFHLHPSRALADVVKTIKVASANWIKDSGKAPLFGKWQAGYGAFSVSFKDKDTVRHYIDNQAEHHAQVDSLNEFLSMLDRAGIEFDPQWVR